MFSKIFLISALVLLSVSSAAAANPVNVLNSPLPHPAIPTVGILPSSTSTSALFEVYGVVLRLSQAVYGLLGGILAKLGQWFQAVTGITTRNFFLDIWNLLLWLLDNVLKVANIITTWLGGLTK